MVGPAARPSADGRDGPFATLERARDAIRGLRSGGTLPPGGVEVVIGAGDYQRDRPFELSAQDTGTAQSPIVYSAGAAGQCVWSAARP